MTSLDAGLAAKVVRTSEGLASRPWIWMGAYSLIFLPLTLLLSSRYAFGYDEIHTIYLSRLPSVRQIWLALAEGADLQPPLIYLTTRLAHSIFGYSEWAARLPSTIGVLVAGLCLMFFVARRTSMLWGFLAATFILLTGVYPHAIEARPYGLVLGFAGTALVCWQCAAEERHRKLALTGLTASLMLAVSSHYYAVLLLVPITLGEAVRSYTNRRIDRAIWCSILTAAPTVFLFLPLLGKSMKAVVNGRTTQVKLSAIWNAYRTLDTAQVTLAVVGLFAIGLFCSLVPGWGKPKIAFPAHETAVALGFLALPVPAFALALTVTHILKDHYVLALTMGGALVFVLTAHRLTSGNTTAGLVLAVLLGGIFVSHTLGRVKTTTLEGAGSVMTDARYPDLDILVSSGLDFAPAWYYAKPALRSRLIFTGDRAMAVRYLNNDQSNSSIPYEARFFHWRVETLDHLRLTHRRFLLNWTAEDSWLLPAYRDFGAKIELLDVNGDRYLFLVTDDHSGDTRSKPN